MMSFKAEIEINKQQGASPKKNKRTNALREVKLVCEDFSFTAGMLSGLVALCREEK